MTAIVYFSRYSSPLGELVLKGDGLCLTGIFFPEHKGWTGLARTWQQADEMFVAVRQQLTEYFAGSRRHFDLRVNLAGTAFQCQVWQELTCIPFGQTISYAELARRVGQPTAARAVGNANGRNPLSIVIPCHRVVGADGKLTGYAGGVAQKAWLLAWEKGSADSRVMQRSDLRSESHEHTCAQPRESLCH